MAARVIRKGQSVMETEHQEEFEVFVVIGVMDREEWGAVEFAEGRKVRNQAKLEPGRPAAMNIAMDEGMGGRGPLKADGVALALDHWHLQLVVGDRKIHQNPAARRRASKSFKAAKAS